MADIPANPWADKIPEGSFISSSPTYKVGEYFNCFHEDRYEGGSDRYSGMKYYYFDPTEHGYPKGREYPVLIFLHGTSNSLVGTTCINYTGAELYASPKYQADFQGAYILVPIANEVRGPEGVEGSWCLQYTEHLYALINEFIAKHTENLGRKFLLGNSSGATMTLVMGSRYPEFFDALIPVGSASIPEDAVLDRMEEEGVHLFYAIGRHDEFHNFDEEVVPRLAKLNSMKNCFVFTPEWVMNGDKGISSIIAAVQMGQHCLMNEVQANLMFDDGTPMDERLPRGLTGWIDEVDRFLKNAKKTGRWYLPVEED